MYAPPRQKKSRSGLSLNIGGVHALRDLLFADGVEYVHGSNSASIEGVCRFRALLSMEDIDRTPWFHRRGGLQSGERGYTMTLCYTGQPVSKGVSMYPAHLAHNCLDYSQRGLVDPRTGDTFYPVLYGIKYPRERMHHAYLDGSIDHPLTTESVSIDHVVRIYVPPSRTMEAYNTIKRFGHWRLSNCVRPCNDLRAPALRVGA